MEESLHHKHRSGGKLLLGSPIYRPALSEFECWVIAILWVIPEAAQQDWKWCLKRTKRYIIGTSQTRMWKRLYGAYFLLWWAVFIQAQELRLDVVIVVLLDFGWFIFIHMSDVYHDTYAKHLALVAETWFWTIHCSKLWVEVNKMEHREKRPYSNQHNLKKLTKQKRQLGKTA